MSEIASGAKFIAVLISLRMPLFVLVIERLHSTIIEVAASRKIPRMICAGTSRNQQEQASTTKTIRWHSTAAPLVLLGVLDTPSSRLGLVIVLDTQLRLDLVTSCNPDCSTRNSIRSYCEAICTICCI